LKATIDMGLAHRDSILKSIASDFEQWNHLVSFYCFLHAFDEILNLKFCPKSLVFCFTLYCISLVPQFHYQIAKPMLQAKREKAIYHTLNMLSVDVTKKCLVAEGWSPVFASVQVLKNPWSRDVFLGTFLIPLFTSSSCMIYNGSLQIQDALQRATLDSKSQVGSIFQVLNTKESPPTYFQTNKFTSAFQEIVDAYGYVL